MLNASSSNNHSIFSFGRSNGSSSTASSSRQPPPVIHTSNDDGSEEELFIDGEDSVPERTIGFDFLPSVSFDDLQSSLESASTEFKLAQFPSPSGQGSILGPQGIVDKMVEQAANVSYGDSSSGARPAAVAAAATAAANATNNASQSNTRLPQSATTPSIGTSARISKSNSILRRPSVSTRQSLSSSTSSNNILDNSTVPASSRQRRQSHYPPVSNTNIAKPPRKSVGPGTYEPEYSAGAGVSRTTSRRRPSLTSNSDRSVTGTARSSLDDGSRLAVNGNDNLRNPNGSRASKARSFQNVASSRASMSAVQDPSKAVGAFPRPPRTVSHSNSTGNFSSSISSSSVNGAKLSTPVQSSASKRMSMAPSLHASHATGLGARTVSPTDARRMKRMSIMPLSTSTSSGTSASNSRDTTQTSTVPLPTPSDARASSRSPSMLPRKTSTPSSSRTTPDPNRKSYSSGFSVGSTMSLNTARTSTGSIQPRVPQTTTATGSGIAGTGSRLPAPKALTMLNPPSNADDDEYVPPVPAIPKAYESPKGSPAELSFLEKRKSNLAFDASSTHSSSTASITGSQQLGLDPPAKIQRKTSLQAAKDSDKMNHTVTGVSMTSSSSKKNLQPLRLPPMNLQPLSKPTTAKIAALQDQIASTPDRGLSPPPSRVIAKTPTTPMTASKGSFFSRHRNEDRADLDIGLRSNSSVHHHTRDDSPNDGDETSSSEMFTGSVISKKSSFQKPSISPYLSASAPKAGGMDPSYFKTPRTPAAEGSDDAYTTPFATPAPPPVPGSAMTATSRKPSGPRAPAPTPSRAFAPIESASTILPSGETSFLMDPMPSLSNIAAHVPKSPPPESSPEEPPTPSSIGSSLRRKLSLSWKRSNSKSSLSMQAGAVSEKASDPSFTDSKRRTDNSGHSHSRHVSSIDKHDGMPPPPRIPKSATMSHVSSTRKSPTPATTTTSSSKGPASYLESRRRKSSASSLNAVLSNEKPKTESWTASDRPPRKDSVQTSNGSAVGHAPSVMHKILHSKHSTASIRHHHDVWSTELDADDMIAEEEIRKMGSRRKETGIAARTLDALRKRATPKERVSAHEATRIAMLNIYERGEIVDYEDVYFCGTQNAAKVIGKPNNDKVPNFGYDDERGDYAIVAGDHLAYRYEIIDLLGKGSFGQVVRCIDHKTGVLVAVKIIRNKKRFHQQALVEVNILQKLREWDPKNKHSMVNFTHSFYFRGHLCISTELLDMNLYEFIKANAFRGFSVKMIRRFTKQMLSSLMLLKQHKVIHCDLKPENVLLRHPLHTEIKVIDFGSSCFENERVYTYIQSRFYRSPEVILGMTYGMPIDMWSLGCILAELFTGVPIFPGENEQEQLACIMEVFGPPEKHLIEKSTRKKLFFDSMGKPRLTVSSKGRRRRPSSKTLQQVIKCDDEAFLDFLARCLRWDPDRRLKPEDAIRHEFMTGQKTVIPPPSSRSTLGARDGSPVRRQHAVSISGTSGPRPLPDPPAGKIGTVPTLRSGGARESLGVSSHKSMNGASSSSRRASAVTSSTVSSMNKRTSASTGAGASNGNTGNTSSLPRAAGRVVSGGTLGSSVSKSDLAAAGAAAAMTRRG